MNRRQITPVEFAESIRRAQAYRADGAPKIVAGATALRELSLSSDWLVPLMGTLETSPVVAEAWAERMISETLDRAFARATPESANQ